MHNRVGDPDWHDLRKRRSADWAEPPGNIQARHQPTGITARQNANRAGSVPAIFQQARFWHTIHRVLAALDEILFARVIESDWQCPMSSVVSGIQMHDGNGTGRVADGLPRAAKVGVLGVEMPSERIAGFEWRALLTIGLASVGARRREMAGLAVRPCPTLFRVWLDVHDISAGKAQTIAQDPVCQIPWMRAGRAKTR